MKTSFHCGSIPRRGAALLVVLAFTIMGGIAVTASICLVASRVQQADRMLDNVTRHLAWGNNEAINQQYSLGYTYRDTVSQAQVTATLGGGWGGQVENQFTSLNAFNSTYTYSSPASYGYPFNNIRNQVTADGSVYYTQTSSAADSSQNEHLLYYNYQKTYPRSLLGDLLIVHAPPSGAGGSNWISDNINVNGRVLIYDSAADVSSLEANECLNLTKAGTNTTLNAAGTGTLLPQNFPSIPIFTAGYSSAGTGAVVDGSLNMLNNPNFLPGSLKAILETGGTSNYTTLSTASTSGNNIKSNSDSGDNNAAVWVKKYDTPPYTPPGTSPYNYSWSHPLYTVTLLLKHASLKHTEILSGVDQLILQGQTTTGDYNTAGTLSPVIIYVDEEIRDIRFVGENNRPIILGVSNTATGQTLYMGFTGTNVTGSGNLRWRMHLINQYRSLWLDPQASRNITITGGIRTNWLINCTDGTATDRFFLNRETSPGTLTTLLPRDAWFEPLLTQ